MNTKQRKLKLKSKAIVINHNTLSWCFFSSGENAYLAPSGNRRNTPQSSLMPTPSSAIKAHIMDLEGPSYSLKSLFHLPGATKVGLNHKSSAVVCPNFSIPACSFTNALQALYSIPTVLCACIFFSGRRIKWSPTKCLEIEPIWCSRLFDLVPSNKHSIFVQLFLLYSNQQHATSHCNFQCNMYN